MVSGSTSPKCALSLAPPPLPLAVPRTIVDPRLPAFVRTASSGKTRAAHGTLRRLLALPYPTSPRSPASPARATTSSRTYSVVSTSTSAVSSGTPSLLCQQNFFFASMPHWHVFH